VSRVDQQPCWILHRRAWRESSLLLELFCPEFGRVGLVARGARGSRSTWRGLAEPFIPLQAGWVRRGEMGTLTGLEPDGQRQSLVGRALWCGLYANELLLKLLGRDDAMPQLFFAYGQLIEALAAGQSQAGSLRRFELVLLQALGVAPDLEHESAGGQAIDPSRLYHLDPEAGLREAGGPGRQVFSGRAIVALATDQRTDPALNREARALTRLLLDHQLAGKTLKTRELLSGQRPKSSAENNVES
jgi:DNA repair protein RecO (recombination protein O)